MAGDVLLLLHRWYGVDAQPFCQSAQPHLHVFTDIFWPGMCIPNLLVCELAFLPDLCVVMLSDENSFGWCPAILIVCVAARHASDPVADTKHASTLPTHGIHDACNVHIRWFSWWQAFEISGVHMLLKPTVAPCLVRIRCRHTLWNVWNATKCRLGTQMQGSLLHAHHPGSLNHIYMQRATQSAGRTHGLYLIPKL